MYRGVFDKGGGPPRGRQVWREMLGSPADFSRRVGSVTVHQYTLGSCLSKLFPFDRAICMDGFYRGFLL